MKKQVKKSKRGKTLKMLKGQICEEDREFIELESPPVLDISFSKQSRQRDFTDPVPDARWQILPVSYYYTFSANIKQTSPGDYNNLEDLRKLSPATFSTRPAPAPFQPARSLMASRPRTINNFRKLEIRNIGMQRGFCPA